MKDCNLRCEDCEMLVDDEPIIVVVYKSNSPFAEDICTFRRGYKCQVSGEEDIDIGELNKRCIRK